MLADCDSALSIGDYCAREWPPAWCNLVRSRLLFAHPKVQFWVAHLNMLPQDGREIEVLVTVRALSHTGPDE
jgi:hypothetical protein